MKLIYSVLLFFSFSCLHAQSTSKWTASMGTSYEKSDIRIATDTIYKFTNLYIGVAYTSFNSSKYKVTHGINMGIDRTSKIENVFFNVWPIIGINYYKYLVYFPTQFTFKTEKKLAVGLNITPQFGFYREVRTDKDVKKAKEELFGETIFTSNSSFFYNTTEFNPFISWTGKRWSYHLLIRAFHLKRVDKMLFREYIYEEDTPIEDRIDLKTIDFYNPLKISFTVGYQF